MLCHRFAGVVVAIVASGPRAGAPGWKNESAELAEKPPRPGQVVPFARPNGGEASLSSSPPWPPSASYRSSAPGCRAQRTRCRRSGTTWSRRMCARCCRTARSRCRRAILTPCGLVQRQGGVRAAGEDLTAEVSLVGGRLDFVDGIGSRRWCIITVAHDQRVRLAGERQSGRLAAGSGRWVERAVVDQGRMVWWAVSTWNGRVEELRSLL